MTGPALLTKDLGIVQRTVPRAQINVSVPRVRQRLVDRVHFRLRVLGAMTGEFLTAGHEILIVEGHADRQQILGHTVYARRRRWRGAKALRWKRRIQHVD